MSAWVRSRHTVVWRGCLCNRNFQRSSSSLLVICAPPRQPIDPFVKNPLTHAMMTDETDIPDDIGALARAHGAAAIAVLAEIMTDADAPAGARISAAKTLLERGWGKAGTKPPDDGNRLGPVT